MVNYQIAASILAADFARLGEEVTAVLEAGADLIHFDVMDNHYVPNLTMGPMVCSALRRYGVTAPIDVHLMVQPVDDLIVEFAKAGASLISFHPEATLHLDKSLQLIRDVHCQAGLVFNPATPLSCLEYVLDKLDFILLMSVNPGFGGQQFIPSALTKLAQVKKLIARSDKTVRIAIDGGINVTNIAQVAAAGADTFIAGSAIFSQADYRVAIAELKQALT